MTLLRWFKGLSFSTAFNFNNSITNATTLYAKWRPTLGSAFSKLNGIAFHNGVACIVDSSLDAVVQVNLSTGNRTIFPGRRAGSAESPSPSTKEQGVLRDDFYSLF